MELLQLLTLTISKIRQMTYIVLTSDLLFLMLQLVTVPITGKYLTRNCKVANEEVFSVPVYGLMNEMLYLREP